MWYNVCDSKRRSLKMALYNKIIYGGETLIDLTGDDVLASDVADGKKFHDRTGALVTGTNTFDADTRDADAIASEILLDKTAYVNGTKLTGTMPNRGAVDGKITSIDTPYTVPNGYHDGTGKVGIDDTEKAKIIAGNIKSGVEILGVTGTYEGEGGTGQSKTVEAYTDADNTILPDTGYDYLTQVKVSKIFYEEQDNGAGGITVTIGKKKPVTP